MVDRRRPTGRLVIGGVADTEVDGEIVQIVTDSAATVSAVFEEKVRHVLAANGITGVSDTAWYTVPPVAWTLERIGEAAGRTVLRRIGGRVVTDDRSLSVPPEPGRAFVALAEFVSEDVHRGPAADRVAACRARRREPGRWRLAAVDGYQYPPAFAEGVFRATAATAAGVAPERVAVEAVTPAADERHAVALSW
ncbi:hypothetical protein [Halobaculum sp. MBLA0143]|uniref:hypothetical protein n=1 Tax=Halobaculum sp. MBLA0143 TaxID=3079933 RepID=UPI003524295D